MARQGRAKSNGAQRRDRSEEVVKAAIKVFNEKGYASASIQDVADAVGVLKGSLYHYIESKEELLARIFEASDRESFAMMEESRKLDVSAVERLHWFARSWSLWYLENIERAAIYVNEWKHLTGPRLKAVVKTRHEYEERVAEMIEAVKESGEASPTLDVRYACFFILTAVNGLPTWYRRRGPDPAEQIAEVYADMIVAMVCHTENAAAKPRSPRPRAKAKAKAKAKTKAKA